MDSFPSLSIDDVVRRLLIRAWSFSLCVSSSSSPPDRSFSLKEDDSMTGFGLMIDGPTDDDDDDDADDADDVVSGTTSCSSYKILLSIS